MSLKFLQFHLKQKTTTIIINIDAYYINYQLSLQVNDQSTYFNNNIHIIFSVIDHAVNQNKLEDS